MTSVSGRFEEMTASHRFELQKARLRVKREGTARLETSTGSRRNLLFTRTNSVMCPTEKGTVRESPLERVLDCLHVVFFETGNDRARDN